MEVTRGTTATVRWTDLDRLIRLAEVKRRDREMKAQGLEMPLFAFAFPESVVATWSWKSAHLRLCCAVVNIKV